MKNKSLVDNDASTSSDMSRPYWTLPVAKLPTEILLDILSLVKDQVVNRKWLRLCGVCQTWRDVVFGYPKIWSEIQIPSFEPVEFLELCLRHLGKLPVSISTSCTDVLPIDEITDAMRLHAERIIELDFCMLESLTVETFLPYLTFPLPRLVSLKLSLDSDEAVLLPYEFPLDHFPNLTKIFLKNICSRWPHLLPASLTSLHLEYPSDSQFALEEEKPSMLDFLQTLTSCPDLEYLTVSGVIQGLEPAGDTSYPHLDLRLSLLKLRKLVTWNDYSIDAAYLLAHISTSPLSTIEVHINFTTVDFDGIMELISAALPVESDRSEMPVFSAVQNLELEFYTDRLVVQAAGVDATPSLSVSFWDLDNYDVRRHIVPVLGEVSELFPVSHVRSLKIVDDTKDFEPVDDVVEPSWWGSMHHFQSLRRLHIVSSQEYAIQGVFQAMDSSLASTADSKSLICRNLKVINVDTSFKLEDAMFEEMTSIIQHRASLGSRLKRFKVINDIDCAPPDGDNWEKLKENVGDLDYIRIILPQVLEGHILKL